MTIWRWKSIRYRGGHSYAGNSRAVAWQFVGLTPGVSLVTFISRLPLMGAG